MVYLLCFKNKLAHAKHYIGFVEHVDGLDARMKKHKNGSGSKLMAAVTKAGIDFTIARLWPNADRNFERKLKNRKKSQDLCPHCMSAASHENVFKNATRIIEANMKLTSTKSSTAGNHPAIPNIVKTLDGTVVSDSI